MELKDYFAENLIKYRKSLKLTQAELAEKLNYSDKAISKWERAESLPDAYTLKNIADFFGTTIDALISKPIQTITVSHKSIPKKRATICLLADGLVWLVAICCYAFLDIFIPSFIHTWLCLVYAVPLTFIVLIVLTSVWGKSLFNMIEISLLVWSTILSVFLTLIKITAYPPNLWKIFLIGIPMQLLVLFFYYYKRVK